MNFYYGQASTRVGLTTRTSQAQVIGAVQDYVRKSKGDISAQSYLAVFKERDGGKGYLDKGDLASFLRDADACAPKSAGSIFAGPDCNATADKVISSMDTTGDGTVSWEEFRDKIGLDPIPYSAPSSSDQEPVGGTATSVNDKYSGFKRASTVDSRIADLYLPKKVKTTTKSGPATKPSESSEGSKFEWTPTKIGLAVGIPLVALWLIRK